MSSYSPPHSTNRFLSIPPSPILSRFVFCSRGCFLLFAEIFTTGCTPPRMILSIFHQNFMASGCLFLSLCGRVVVDMFFLTLGVRFCQKCSYPWKTGTFFWLLPRVHPPRILLPPSFPPTVAGPFLRNSSKFASADSCEPTPHEDSSFHGFFFFSRPLNL